MSKTKDYIFPMFCLIIKPIISGVAKKKKNFYLDSIPRIFLIVYFQ